MYFVQTLEPLGWSFYAKFATLNEARECCYEVFGETLKLCRIFDMYGERMGI